MKQKKLNKDLIPKLKEISERLIDQSRFHVVQISIISGVFASFLIPLYTSSSFSNIKHMLIAISLVCFLLAILIGTLYVSFKIPDDQKGITEMIDILETDDYERAKEYQKKHEKSLRWRTSLDIKTLLVDILFFTGVASLIVLVFINESGWLFMSSLTA